MKICLLNNLYAPYDRGGAEKVTTAYLNKLQNQGHEVFIISTRPKKLFKSELKDENRTRFRAKLKDELLAERENKTTIYYLNSLYSDLAKLAPIFRLFWHFNNILSVRKYLQIKKILKIEKPDLCISHNLMGLGFLSVQALQKFSSAHYHYLHDIQLLHPSGLMYWGEENKINSSFAKIYQAINKYFFKSVLKVISPSQWLLDEHLQRGFFKKSQTELEPISNILQAKTIKIKVDQKLNAKQNKDTNKKKLLFAGQLERHKGVLFLLESFLKWNDANLELIIAGSGSLENKIKELSANNPNIKLSGYLVLNDLKKLLSQVDLVIVPSSCYENSPTIILEAQNLNIPVLASNIGGIPEIVNPENQLFDPEDANDLYEKLKLMIN